MSDKITSLHPYDDLDTDLKPNIVSDNIPEYSVYFDQLSSSLQLLINQIPSNLSDVFIMDYKTKITTYPDYYYQSNEDNPQYDESSVTIETNTLQQRQYTANSFATSGTLGTLNSGYLDGRFSLTPGASLYIYRPNTSVFANSGSWIRGYIFGSTTRIFDYDKDDYFAIEVGDWMLLYTNESNETQDVLMGCGYANWGSDVSVQDERRQQVKVVSPNTNDGVVSYINPDFLPDSINELIDEKIDEEIESIDEKIESIDVSVLKGKKVVVLGDSLTAYVGGGGATWCTDIANATGCTMINLARSSAMLQKSVEKSTLYQTYYYLDGVDFDNIEATENWLEAIGDGDPDYVIINHGHNGGYTADTDTSFTNVGNYESIVSCTIMWYRYLKQLYPQCKILFMNEWLYSDSDAKLLQYTLFPKENNIPYWDSYKDIGLNFSPTHVEYVPNVGDTLLYDTLHLNSKGHAYIANAIRKKLESL